MAKATAKKKSKAKTKARTKKSVAEGIAQPFKVSILPKFMNTYINAGTNMPPIAAIIGRVACLVFESSPCINSLLISSVTKKKRCSYTCQMQVCYKVFKILSFMK